MADTDIKTDAKRRKEHDRVTQLSVGEEVKVRHQDGGCNYTLGVEVMAVCPPNEFIGRIKAIFETGLALMITGGELYRELIGQNLKFKNEDVVLRRTDLP